MKFSYTKNTESDFFYKETKLNKKIWRLGGEGVARVSDFIFSQKNPSLEQEGHEALNCTPEYTGQSQTFNFEI